ncbi:DmsC/YnfH family molybdoenzyme membrane anchor subunit [Planktotalea sp.]|uniref:dimethyl sulfoxide reductase anchor subunit family protein n=1 Tax=Planktotalea sp. TaxID=2029877 RepID=UPI0025E7712E|nr:DmsC/YnfH family molybdoenzyme membrane anchor subunit [Planktotalea sp.]
MHPAPSIILFTTLSGFGFGLLTFLGLGMPNYTGFIAFVFFAIAYVLAVGGLLFSTFHLGHPERALKAFSQWRSSWLSREGICAVGALIVMAIYGVGRVFFAQHWGIIGGIGAILSLLTVYTTSMIYAQLKTVPRWNMPLTSPLFMALAITGGALLAAQVKIAIFMLIFSAIIQVAYWVMGDGRLAASGTNMETATGLGHIGKVKAFEPPHTGTNYLMREFIHVVGRKHAMKLRTIALVLGFVLPVIFLLLPFGHIFALFAVLCHIAGIFTSRWLFFAQAEHVVGLYYGKR